MKIKNAPIEIDKVNPFLNCKLNRYQYAGILTDIVSSYADGFVMAINNEWGAGKTTFVKMWQQHLLNNDFKTLYFNAWENDLENNPLVAIMGELKTLETDLNKETYISVLKKGAVLTQNILPGLIKGIAKQYIDIEAITDNIENSIKATADLFKEEVDAYAVRKKTLINFRNDLEAYIKQTSLDKPIVFIIDELDRCKPSYAVEVLEQIKHFFSVQGIVFVLSIDKTQLGHAIRGVYGSEHINADEYLRRFIDIEYSIPFPNQEEYCKYLFQYFSFDEFFYEKSRKQITSFESDASLFIKMATQLFENKKVTLRQQEKIFSHTRLVLRSFKYNNYVFPQMLFFLIFLRTIHYDIYSKICNRIYSLEELRDVYFDFMPNNIDNIKGVNLIYLESLLLYFYNNQSGDIARNQLYEVLATGEILVNIPTKLSSFSRGGDQKEIFKQINSEWDYRHISLSFFTDRINLTMPIQL